MDVRKWMKCPLHSVKPLDAIQHARELMEHHRINQLPVVVNGRLVGIITDRDLRDAFPSIFDSPDFARPKRKLATTDPRRVPVEMVMTPDVMTIGPGDSMVAAAQLMRRQRIGALPVVEANRVVAIVSRSDVLDCFLDRAPLEEERESGGLPKAAARKPAAPRGETSAAGQRRRRGTRTAARVRRR